MDDVYGLYMYALETWYLLLAQEEGLLLVQEKDLLLVQEEDFLLVQEDEMYFQGTFLRKNDFEK